MFITKPEAGEIEVSGTCRIGFSGSHSHAFVGVQDAQGRVRGYALCSSGRIGQRQPHSVRVGVPLNTSTVTCESCRGFRCVEKL